MSLTFASLRHTLWSIIALGSMVATLLGPPMATFATSRAHDLTAPQVGGDLYHIDTDTGFYTQGDNNSIHLRLFNSPIGIPSANGWGLRDPSLNVMTATGTITPTAMPFDLRIAPTTGGPTLATLTTRAKGATFGIGLVSVGGVTPATVAGQTNGDTITYPAVASLSDVTVRATVSGLDVGVTLPDANAAGSVVFALTPDPRTHLDQQPGGAIVATRPITTYARSGDPYVVQGPEHVVGPASATDSSADPTALARPGAVSMALAPGSNGRQLLTLTVDAAWLRDPARAFPVHLDLPVALAAQAAHSHLLGTVNSCTPDAAGAPTLVVGLEGNCAYHGLLRFDVAQLRGDAQVATATLRLYTPNQTGPTGVLVYPNAPAWQTEPRLGQPLPSWNGAPAISGTVGIAQSASDGHWQSWDITGLVQQWVQRGYSYNTGITLVGTGGPVLFAAPSGSGITLGNLPTTSLPTVSTTPTASSPIAGQHSQANSSFHAAAGATLLLRADAGHTRSRHGASTGRIAAHALSRRVRVLPQLDLSAKDVARVPRLATRSHIRPHTAMTGEPTGAFVSVPGQCYLIPGAPNLCLPMMAPPDITVGPPAVSLPTPHQCYPLTVAGQKTGYCIPIVDPNQAICVTDASCVNPAQTPPQCYTVTNTARGICLPTTSPTPLNPALCYRIPDINTCLPLAAPGVDPSPPSTTRLRPGGQPPMATPPPVGGSANPPPSTVPTRGTVLGCLTSFVRTSGGGPILGSTQTQPLAPISSVSCEAIVAPAVDMVYSRPGAASGTNSSGSSAYSDGSYVNFGIASAGWDQSEMDNVYSNGPNRVLYGNYARFSISLNCGNQSPGESWWGVSNSGANPNLVGSSFDVLQRAYNNGITPIVNPSIDAGNCPNDPGFYFAYNEFLDYGNTLLNHFSSFPRLTYFEVQNEPNVQNTNSMPPTGTPMWVYNQNDPNVYDYYFTNAAIGLYNSLTVHGISNWVALTGGVDRPTAQLDGCSTGTSILAQMEDAVGTAEYYGVPSQYLGAAVHPYSYAGGGNYYFPYWYNFDTYWGVSQYRNFDNMCFSFEDMVNTWTNAFPNMPVIITEINWASDANYNGKDPYIQPNLTNFQAAYLADVFTWMGDHGFAASDSPLRLTWFTIKDFPDAQGVAALGLYDQNGNDTKAAALPYCPGDSGLQSAYTEPIIYGQMVFYRCY